MGWLRRLGNDPNFEVVQTPAEAVRTRAAFETAMLSTCSTSFSGVPPRVPIARPRTAPARKCRAIGERNAEGAHPHRRTKPCVGPEPTQRAAVSPEEDAMNGIVEEAVSWCYMHGLVR